MPSKVPEVGSECYSVDLDDITGIHHVTLRNASLRKDTRLTDLSNPSLSSHAVEFSNGEMTAVPRVNCATNSSKRDARKTPHREYQWDRSIAQPRPVGDVVRQNQFGSSGQDDEIDEVMPFRDQVANNHRNVAGVLDSRSHEVISYMTLPGLAGSDNSITGSGRVVGQLAADDQSSLSNFSESVIHIVPRKVTPSTSIEAEGSDVTAQAQEPVATAIDLQTSESSSTSRRSSAGRQISGASTSTVPTSPASSLFSTLPFWKSALANLPKVPITPGKPNYMIEALALEKQKNDDLEKTNDPDKTVIRRLSWGLRISYRQLKYLDEIEDGESPRLEEVSAPVYGLAMTEEGQIVVAEDTSRNAQSSLTSPQLISRPVEALPLFHADKNHLSQLFEALDVVRVELVGQKYSRLFPLDLVPEAKGKQRATDAPKGQQLPPGHDETDVEIAIDSASGKLYLRSRMNAPPVAIQSISAATGTNVATKGSVPAQNQLSNDSAEQPTRLEDIDLTAEFNQGATDLDDEEMYTAPSTIASHIIGSRLAQTQDIPSEVADYVEYVMQAQPFVPGILVEANEYWNFLKANIDGTWYAQGCPRGFLLRRPLCENDSDDVFRELLGLGRKLKTVIDVEAPKDLRVGFPVHHYNLIDEPVFRSSRNSSAVSYWAAIASFSKVQIADGISWKAVVSSQAAKWVDPCSLSGVVIPDDLRATGSSTALRNFLIGQTTILYGPWGTWRSDDYDAEQEIPEVMSIEDREAMLNASSRANDYPGLQRPHFMVPNEGDTNVNDDGTGRAYPALRFKKEKEWETLETRGPTNLRVVDDGTGRVYSFKGMKETKVWEILEKYETRDFTFILPSKAEPGNVVEESSDASKAEPSNAVEELSNETDADENEGDSSEAETDIPDEAVFDREPINYQNTLLITEGSAAADSSEGTPRQIKSFGSDMPKDDSHNDAVINEEAAAEQGPVTQANTCTSLVVFESPALEKPFEQLEEELEAKATSKIELPKQPECFAHTVLGVFGKKIMSDIKAQSYKYISNVDDDDDEVSNNGSIAGAGYDNIDHSSTWAKRPEPKDQTDLGLDGSSQSVHTEAINRLAYWSSSPRRVLRGECSHSYTFDSETEENERHPNLDWDSMDMIADYAELFNIAHTEKRTKVDPNFDEHVTNLLGSGALARKMMSGQGIIPRTTGRMMTLLGSGGVEKILDGYGHPRATTGMVTFLGTGAVSDMVCAPQGKSNGVNVPSPNSVDDTISARSSTPSATQSTDTRESPVLSGRNLSPTKMLSSAMGQPETPPQSPEADENLGVWEDDGNGGFESPGKHRYQYTAKDVKGQGDHFDDDVDIFDSAAKDTPASVQRAFHKAMVLPKAKAVSAVADRATNFDDEEAPSTPVRSAFGILSPIPESQTPIQRVRAPTSNKPSWIPFFTRGGRQTRFAARK